MSEDAIARYRAWKAIQKQSGAPATAFPPNPPPQRQAISSPGNPEPTFLDNLKTTLSNRPQGSGAFGAAAFAGLGGAAALAATAAPPAWPVLGANLAIAGLGGAGGELVRQGVGAIAQQYDPKFQPQIMEAGRAGAETALGELFGAGLRQGGRFGMDAAERLNAKLFQAEKSAIPYSQTERLAARGPFKILGEASEEGADYEAGQVFRQKFAKGIEKKKAIWGETKEAMIQKYGAKKVVNLSGARTEMLKVLDDAGIKQGKDRLLYREYRRLIETATDKPRVDVKTAMDQVKRFNRHLTFEKTKAVDPKTSLDDAIVNRLKESYYKKVDAVDPAFAKQRQIYAGARQLERDLAPTMNSKDFPNIVRNAYQNRNDDWAKLEQIQGIFKGLQPVMEELRDSIAGQYFRRPLDRAFGWLWGGAAHTARQAAPALQPSLGPTAGALGGGVRRAEENKPRRY